MLNCINIMSLSTRYCIIPKSDRSILYTVVYFYKRTNKYNICFQHFTKQMRTYLRHVGFQYFYKSIHNYVRYIDANVHSVWRYNSAATIYSEK